MSEEEGDKYASENNSGVKKKLPKVTSSKSAKLISWKKKRKGEGNLLIIKDYFSGIQKADAGLLLQVPTIFIEVTMHCSAMQPFIVLLCIFDT